MLDDSSQRVTVSNNERLLAFEHRAGDMVIPEGKNSNNGILQAFSGREDILGELLVAGVVVGVSRKNLYNSKEMDFYLSSLSSRGGGGMS